MSFPDTPQWWTWTTGERWNGAGTPHFEREEAEKMARWLHQNGWFRAWWWDDDKLCTQWAEDGDESDCWPSKVIETPLGDRMVWSVGARAWMWEVNVDDEEQALESRRALEQHVWGIPRGDNLGDLKRRLMP